MVITIVFTARGKLQYYVLYTSQTPHWGINPLFHSDDAAVNIVVLLLAISKTEI
jgi:hypothetical protein